MGPPLLNLSLADSEGRVSEGRERGGRGEEERGERRGGERRDKEKREKLHCPGECAWYRKATVYHQASLPVTLIPGGEKARGVGTRGHRGRYRVSALS